MQFGELCASADVKMAERTWKAHRREGAEALKSRGYDPVPHAYAVAHSLTLSTRNRLAERLTRREVQVLGLLADGLSYRKVAEQLEVAAPTVQTLAHRVYQKLGVSGRGVIRDSRGKAPRGALARGAAVPLGCRVRCWIIG